MPVAIALIRGINVGSTRSLPMQTLRELCEEVGMKEPRTLIQSGNVVFNWSGKGLAGAAANLEEAIEGRVGFRPGVVIRTRDELGAAVDANPFPKRAAEEPGKVLVMFLKGVPPAGAGAALEGLKRGREQIRLAGKELYLDFPDGVGKSRLSLASLEKACGVPGTTRNWNTTLKLLAMAGEGAG